MFFFLLSLNIYIFCRRGNPHSHVFYWVIRRFTLEKIYDRAWTGVFFCIRRKEEESGFRRRKDEKKVHSSIYIIWFYFIGIIPFKMFPRANFLSVWRQGKHTLLSLIKLWHPLAQNRVHIFRFFFALWKISYTKIKLYKNMPKSRRKYLPAYKPLHKYKEAIRAEDFIEWYMELAILLESWNYSTQRLKICVPNKKKSFFSHAQLPLF